MNKSLIQKLSELLPQASVANSQIEGVNFYHRDRANADSFYFSHPMVSFIVQGRKRTVVGELAAEYGQGQLLAIGAHVPGHCTVMIPEDSAPFLSISVDLDLNYLSEIFSLLPAEFSDRAPFKVLEAGLISEKIEALLLRILEISKDPVQSKILGPLVIKELHYQLAVEPIGAFLRSLCSTDSRMVRILNAAELIRNRYNEEIDIAEISSQCAMSGSSFYRHFKDVIGLSPIQYQKKVRLTKARQMIVSNNTRISSAAAEVGYLDFSQFSREYRREFGRSPREEKEVSSIMSIHTD